MNIDSSFTFIHQQIIYLSLAVYIQREPYIIWDGHVQSRFVNIRKQEDKTIEIIPVFHKFHVDEKRNTWIRGWCLLLSHQTLI